MRIRRRRRPDKIRTPRRLLQEANLRVRQRGLGDPALSILIIGARPHRHLPSVRGLFRRVFPALEGARFVETDILWPGALQADATPDGSVDVLACLFEAFVGGAARHGVGAEVVARRADFGAGEAVETDEGVVDLAEGPPAGSLAGLVVVGAVVVVAVDEEVRVEVEPGLEAAHHPGEGDVGEVGVVVAAAAVGVDAREPDLFQVGDVVVAELPEGG